MNCSVSTGLLGQHRGGTGEMCSPHKSLGCALRGGTLHIWAMLSKRGRVSRESREAEPRHNCDLVTPNKKPSLAPDCQVDKIQTPQGGMQSPSHTDPRMTSPSSSPGLRAPSHPPSHPSLDDHMLSFCHPSDFPHAATSDCYTLLALPPAWSLSHLHRMFLLVLSDPPPMSYSPQNLFQPPWSCAEQFVSRAMLSVPDK